MVSNTDLRRIEHVSEKIYILSHEISQFGQGKVTMHLT